MVEVAVTLIILSVVLAAATGFILVASKIFHTSTVSNEQRLIFESCEKILTQRVRNGVTATIGDGGLTGDTVLTFQEGRLYMGEEDLFSSEFYGGNTVFGSFTKVDDQTVRIALTVQSANGKEQISREIVLALSNLALSGQKIVGSTGRSMAVSDPPGGTG